MKLSDSQLDKLADITADLGTLFVASVVLPAVLNKFDLLVFIRGTALAFMFWLISLGLIQLAKQLKS